MKVENKSKSRVIKFLNGKAFYAVLCICFVAIGVAAWTGVQSMKDYAGLTSSAPSVASETPSVPTPPSQPEITADTSKPESKPESSAPSAPSEPESEQTAAPVATFFVNPVLGSVMKGFSDSELQYSMTLRDMRLHCGVDIAADAGTPVIAAGSGVVTAVYADPMLGSVVEIDHGNGITARYCGLNAVPCVNVGDTVDTSTELGTVDTVPSESVEQKHLHLEFVLNGAAVSPLNYIKN